MEESDPDPALASPSSRTICHRVAGEEAEEAECSGMESGFAAWKRTGPLRGARALSKFPSESKNAKVYVKRKAQNAGFNNIFEAPLKKQNVEILAGAEDAEVDPSDTASSLPPEIVVADISQATVNDKTENASRNNQRESTVSNVCTTLPHPTQLEERKSAAGESPTEPLPTLSASEVDRQRSGVELTSSNVNGEEQASTADLIQSQVSTADLIQPHFRNVTVTPETSKVDVAALVVTNEQVAASKDPSNVKPVTIEGDHGPANLAIEDGSASMECLQSETKLPVPMSSCENVHVDSQEAGLIQLELENGTEIPLANRSEAPALVVVDDQVAAASNGASRVESITAENDQHPTTSVRIEEALTSVECLQSEANPVTVFPEASKAVAAAVTMTDDDPAVATNGCSEVEWVTVEVNQWPPNCSLVIEQASALLKCLRSAAKCQGLIGSSGNADGALQEAGFIQSKPETVSHSPESSKAVAAACLNVADDQAAPLLNGPSEIESVTAEADQSATSSLGNEEVSALVECMQWEAKLPGLVDSCENVHGDSQESSLVQLEFENATVLPEASKPVAALFIVTDCELAASNGHCQIGSGTAQVDQSAASTAGIKETLAPVERMQSEAKLPVPVEDASENVHGKSKEAGEIHSDLEHAKVLLETSKHMAAAADLVTDHQAAAASNAPSEVVLVTGDVDRCATSGLQTKQASASVTCMQSEAKLRVPMGSCVNVPHEGSQEGLKTIVTNPETLGSCVSNAAVVSPVKPDLLAAPKAKRTPLTFRPLETCVVGNHSDSATSGVLNTMASPPAAPVMSNVNSMVLLAKRSPLPPAAPVMSNANSMVLLARRSPLPLPVRRPPSSNSENFQVASVENLLKQQKSSGVSSPMKPKDNQFCEATGRQSVWQGKAGLEIIADIINPEENSDPNKDGDESRSAVSEENVHLGCNPRISGIRSARKGNKPAKKEARTESLRCRTDTPVRHWNQMSCVQSETLLETGGRGDRQCPEILHQDHERVSSVRRPRSARKSYLCSKCMVLKKGHKCPLGGTGSKDGEGRVQRQDSAAKVSGPPAADPRAPPQSTRLKLRLRVKPPVKTC